jgi:16S rRNA processing protein RimM
VADWVELGRIGAPYGVRGWLHVQSFTEPALALLDYRPWSLKLASGARLTRTLGEGRRQGRGLIVRLEDVHDRDAAAALSGAAIEVERQALPPPGERQFYRADLIGLTVRNREGAQLGTVRYFVEVAGRPLMVVAGASEHWVPAIPQHLCKVDVAGGWILVDWPAELE